MTHQEKQELERMNRHLLSFQNIINNILSGMAPDKFAEMESQTETAYKTDPLITPETEAVFTLLLDRIHRDYY